MRVIVLINRAAGLLRGGDGDVIGRSLATDLARRNIEAQIVFGAGDEMAKTALLVREAVERGDINGVIVAGGDGTVRTVANILAGSDVPLGILPMGTLNHFARDLGLPLDIEAAIDVIAGGRVRSVDVGSVNGSIFVNNSSVGVYPYMVTDRDRRRSSSGLGKWPAMFLAGLRALRRFPFRRLTMYLAGQAKPYRTPILFVGNNEYDLSLFSLGRRRQLDSGRLHVYVVHARNRLSFILLVLRALFGFGRSAPELDLLDTLAFDVRSRTSRLPVALDGEVQVMQPPLRYKIMPAALKVFAPAAAA